MRFDRVVDTTYLKRIDSAQSPKEIDLGISPEGFYETRPMSGIYKLEENELTYCWAHPNKSRPSEFKAEPGSRHTIVRLERFSTGEQEILKQLSKDGIMFELDDEAGWTKTVQLTTDQNPADYFPIIAKLKKIKTIHASNVDDKSLAELAGLKHLSWLSLHGDQLTDRGLSIIPSLPKLSTLHLDSSSLTDDGLVHLTRMPANSELLLKGTKVSSYGLKQLKQLSLRALTINENELTTEDLEAIVNIFPNLLRISLEDCQIADAGFDSLAKLSKLMELNLSGTSFNDQAMKEIVRIKTISNLKLDRTTITDDGLATAAKGLANLQYFSVRGNSKISDKGLKELYNAKNLIYFWASPGTFSSKAMKRFNNDAVKSRVYER